MSACARIEPLREGLLRVADSLIQKAMMRIGYPTRDQARNVHFIRVTIKRLRALLRLIRPVDQRDDFRARKRTFEGGWATPLFVARFGRCPTNAGDASALKRP